MIRPRRKLLSLIADLAIRAHADRPDDEDQADRVRRFSFETNTRRMGTTMTAFLRDRLRRSWLRLHRSR